MHGQLSGRHLDGTVAAWTGAEPGRADRPADLDRGARRTLPELSGDAR